VERGIRNESFAEISEGLEEGEIVLSAPDNSIEEGMRIKAISSVAGS
jgi:HlyD family secretion protein